MKSVFFVALLSVLCSGHANAEITTKKQADQFITQYCISLVNSLENNLKRSKEIKSEDEILEAFVTGAEANNIIDTYMKLCK